MYGDHLNQYIDIPLPFDLLVKHFTPDDFKFTIQKYSLKKSPGYELITTELAGCVPKTAIVLVTVIFNVDLKLTCCPLLWKISIIILVPKANKLPDVLSSYRPINILPSSSKSSKD